MARLFSSRKVISLFSGEDGEGLFEVVFPGIDDELGMEDELDADSEPDFEPPEVPDNNSYNIQKKSTDA